MDAVLAPAKQAGKGNPARGTGKGKAGERKRAEYLNREILSNLNIKPGFISCQLTIDSVQILCAISLLFISREALQPVSTLFPLLFQVSRQATWPFPLSPRLRRLGAGFAAEAGPFPCPCPSDAPWPWFPSLEY